MPGACRYDDLETLRLDVREDKNTLVREVALREELSRGPKHLYHGALGGIAGEIEPAFDLHSVSGEHVVLRLQPMSAGAVAAHSAPTEGEHHEHDQAADFPAHSLLPGMKPCSMSGFTRARNPTVNPRMSPSIAAMKR